MNSQNRTLYHPSRRHGWAFPYLNFAGRGYRFNLGARPRSDWDFTSKIHDIMFYVNDIQFNLNPPNNWKKRSKLEKADYIFRVMSKRIELNAPEYLLNRISKFVFAGKDTSRFRENDKFTNIIHIPELTAENSYYMIPWAAIPKQERVTVEQDALEKARNIFNQSSLRSIHAYYRINTRKRVKNKGNRKIRESSKERKLRIIGCISDEIKYNTATSVDQQDWKSWAQNKFSTTWDEILTID